MGKYCQVLVVEDDDHIASALEYVIGTAGLIQERIANGREALARIKAAPPALVLLDVMLPDLSGYEICNQMRRDPALAQVKILLMSAGGAALVRARGQELGADGVLPKPFELQQLRAELARLLPR